MNLVLFVCKTMHVKWLITCIVIFQYIQRRPQKNSSNKRITNIPLYFLLQQQFAEDIIKGDIMFIYFLLPNILFFVGF